MSEDIEIRNSNVAVQDAYELQHQQVQALTVLADGVSVIARFLTDGGLSNLVSSYARTKAAGDILGGLANHDGRKSLDARVLKQNAVEIVAAFELVFDKFKERLNNTEVTDPEVHVAVEEPGQQKLETEEEFLLRKAKEGK